MAENKTKSDTSSAKKKNQKMYALAIGGAVVVYFLYKHFTGSSSSSSTTPSSGIDPLTGQPYQSGVGSLASGALTGGSGVPTSSSGIDPATGFPYASELSALGGGSSSTPSDVTTTNNDQTYTDLVTNNFGSVTPSTGVSTTRKGPIPSASAALDTWTTDVTTAITRAGVNPAAAAQAVSQYKAGKPVTNASAYHALAAAPKMPTPHHAPPLRYKAPVQVRY